MRARTLCLALVAGCVAADPAATGEDAGPSADGGVLEEQEGCDGQFLVELRGQVLTRVEADGAERELFRLGEAAGLGGDDVVVSQWEVRGDLVALVGFLYAPPSPHRYEYVVVDIDGNVRFHLIKEEPHSPRVHLAADGSLAVAGGQGFVAGPDGSVTPIGDRHPLVAPQGRDVLVASEAPWRPGASFGWLALDDLAFTPLAVQPSEHATFAALGDIVAYPAGDGRLALTSPSSTVVAEVEGGGALHVIRATPDERHALVASYDVPRVYRLDRASAMLAPLEDAEPEPWAYQAAFLDPAGHILRSSRREDGTLQLVRTADLGASWQEVGQPMTPAQDLGAGSHLVPLARGPRVMILNFSRGFGDYLDGVQLVSPDGTSQEVSAGGIYVNGDVDPGSADLAEDGSCAATWVRRQGGVDHEAALDLLLIDPATGSSRILRSSSQFSLLRFGPRRGG
jgi:hypothetical protein